MICVKVFFMREAQCDSAIVECDTGAGRDRKSITKMQYLVSG